MVSKDYVHMQSVPGMCQVDFADALLLHSIFTAFTAAFQWLLHDAQVMLLGCSYAIKKKDEIERVAKANR